MSEPWSVHDQPDFERVYDEDEMVNIRKGDLRALLDVATGSMDFGSCMLDNEEVEILRKTAGVLGIDPLVVTQRNFRCQYEGGHHLFRQLPNSPGRDDEFWSCERCGAYSNSAPPVADRQR